MGLTLTEGCWLIVEPAGWPYDEAAGSHYTAASARAAGDDYDGATPMRFDRVPGACMLIGCDGCGFPLPTRLDTEVGIHLDAKAEAPTIAAHVLAVGWRFIGPSVACPDCDADDVQGVGWRFIGPACDAQGQADTRLVEAGDIAASIERAALARHGLAARPLGCE